MRTFEEVAAELWQSYRVVQRSFETPCWEWTKSCVPNGYGCISYLGKKRHVHRFAWESLNGPIPSGLQVCHKCDNPPCFRPDHLFLGTAADNIRDAILKGRFTLHFVKRKLTPENVEEIRKSFAMGAETQHQLGRRFGVSQENIWHIVHRNTWKHVS